MITNRRHRGPLAVGGLALGVLLTLSACGASGGSAAGSSSTPAASKTLPASVDTALNNLASCLGQHGITVHVPSPVTRKAIRGVLQGMSTTQRQTALTDCSSQVNSLLALRSSLRKGK